MLFFALFALFGACAQAALLTKVDNLSTSLEEFSTTCPVTGYQVRGCAWSHCHNGTSTVTGCIGVDGRRVALGETFVDSVAEWMCYEEGGKIILKPTACIVDQNVLRIGDTVKSGKFYVSCVQSSQGIAVTVVGCSDRQGQLMPVGSTYLKGKFMYKCDEDERSVFDIVIGCKVGFEMLKIGGTAQSGDFIVECQRKGKRSGRLEIIGCSDSQGNLLGDGDRFSHGIVVYQCTETISETGRSSFTFEPVGCLVRDFQTQVITEYVFGDTWTEEYQKDIKYVVQCTHEGEKVSGTIIGCSFDRDSDGVHDDVIPTGCARQTTTHVLVCKTTETGAVQARKQKITSSSPAATILAQAGVPEC